jgi:glycerol-3-phosphate acyltransferase PlsX
MTAAAEGPTIALDVMGGDRAPDATVEGAIRWARATGQRAIMVGDVDVMCGLLSSGGESPSAWRLESGPATIGMDEHPVQAVRSTRDASIRRCAELVRSGEAQALVSMGNTGATMAAGVLLVGRAAGVDRPGLAVLIPSRKTPTLLIDVGANAEARPEHLRDFALMGAVYSRQLFGIAKPRTGVLSIGEEATKGSPLTLAAAELLAESPLDFFGNVEPGGLFNSSVDVAVCDGFTGNLVLKAFEATAEFAVGELRAAVRRRPYTLPGVAFMYPAFRAVRRRTDYAQYGGTPLLGVNGVVIIGHGRSNAVAVENALHAAARAVESRLVDRVTDGMASISR